MKYQKDLFPNIITVIGNGTSISNYIEQINKLNCLKIGCNLSYRWLKNDIQMFKDVSFYNQYRDEVDKLPFVCTTRESDKDHIADRIIKLPMNQTNFEGIDALEKGKSLLFQAFIGTMAIHLAISILKDFKGTIYLLGMDFNNSENSIQGKKQTHFFQNEVEKYGGFGKTRLYVNNCNYQYKYFHHFVDLPNINIINVIGEPKSRIEVFPTLEIDEFFKTQINDSFNPHQIKTYLKDLTNK